jgi:ribosomal protein S18 acetylase RimI-like enzyme
MEFHTLEQIPIEALRTCFNASFADYELPLQMDETAFIHKLIVEDINLSISVGAFYNNALVGFILFGLDTVNGTVTAWDGGTGVIPAYRGQQLTQRMFEYAAPILKGKGTKRVILEVLENNIGAHRIYQKIGFKDVRKLHAYKGYFGSTHQQSHTIEVQTNYDTNTLTNLCDWQPAWQQMNNRVSNWGDAVTTIAIKQGRNIIAYAHYTTLNKHATPSRRVLQFAVAKEHRRQGSATALFQHIAGDNSLPITVINVDEHSDNSNSFLKSIGLECFVSQYEMEIKIL